MKNAKGIYVFFKFEQGITKKMMEEKNKKSKKWKKDVSV